MFLTTVHNIVHQYQKAYNYVDNDDNSIVTKHQTDNTSDIEAHSLSKNFIIAKHYGA